MEPFHAKLVAAATGSTSRPSPTPRETTFPQPPPNVCCQPQNVTCVRRMSSLARTAVEGEAVCIWDHGVMRTERVNGFSTQGIMGVPSATCYMLTYDHLLNVTLPPLLPSAALVPLTAGMMARTIVTSCVSPLELVRTRLQSTPLSPDNPHTLRSVIASVRVLVEANGVRFLWRGLGPTLWRDVPFSGIYWAGYETWKRAFGRRGMSGPQVAFASGAISGTTAALLTSPFDVLKTRRQALMTTGSGKTTKHSPWC
ncbi:mitochondrial carrier domain-containing protein [Amylocystis lapponica]|nr:mitochondrial carrier domain-containing protein [Amylocystis lapponica]